MNYQQAEQYLNQCSLLGSKPGLSTVTKLLETIGNPQNDLRFVHIAGTNGKGSIGAFLQSTLTEANYKVGFFTSPFLECRREMIRLNGEYISEDAFASVLAVVKHGAEKMIQEGFSQPTEFELLTAAAYEFFRREQCDYVIAEAGMGGRLDATNVMKTSMVSILARIDYDHVAFLGETLTEIAREKCGIFRPDCPVVVYPDQEQETLSVIQSEAEKKNCPLVLPLKHAITTHACDKTGSRFSYGKMKQLSISLCGEHQVYNAVTALLALSVLQENGVAISERAIRIGFQKTAWSGRFEVLQFMPPVILDGAHNVNGACAFSKAIEACYPGQSFVGVVGMLKDKDFKAALAEFGRVCDRLVVTKVPNPRAAEPAEFKVVAEELGIPVTEEVDPVNAVRQAFQTKTPDQGVFCVGSLYALTMFRKGCEHCLPKKNER